MALAGFTLLQLFSLCGLCRSKDKSFQQDIDPHHGGNFSREALYLSEDKDKFRMDIGSGVEKTADGSRVIVSNNYSTVEMPQRA